MSASKIWMWRLTLWAVCTYGDFRDKATCKEVATRYINDCLIPKACLADTLPVRYFYRWLGLVRTGHTNYRHVQSPLTHQEETEEVGMRQMGARKHRAQNPTCMLAGPHSMKLASRRSRIRCRLLCTWGEERELVKCLCVLRAIVTPKDCRRARRISAVTSVLPSR